MEAVINADGNDAKQGEDGDNNPDTTTALRADPQRFSFQNCYLVDNDSPYGYN